MQLIAQQFVTRQARLTKLLQTSGLDLLLLNPGASLKYLTGLNFHLSERPVTVFFTPHNSPIIVLPELEAQKTINLPYSIEVFTYPEDPSTWLSIFKQALQASGIDTKNRIGIEPRNLRLLEYWYVESAGFKVEFLTAEDILTNLRIMKDNDEIMAMRKAVEIAQIALDKTLPAIKMGVTELDIASELTLQILRAGSDPELRFSPIISSGPNSANPHATPTARALSAGDLLVIDWGASYKGYFSDITRTFVIQKMGDKERKIAKVVENANEAGRHASKPGISANDLDFIVRDIISKAGYGEHFIHRTGHGLGMEGHEPPYIRTGNNLNLETGMVFTIEPGIYLPELYGVRIEDNVVITETGSDCLTDLPRELKILG